ncbi:MAG: tRNA (N6-isopentenyl adenosine(37)-C2)-methylthiotransferase MiaB [Nitrospirota bacterium]
MPEKSKSYEKSAPRVYIRTFGCQMNFHDSERIAGILRNEGYTLTEYPNSADLIIINTCSVREKAEQKFYSELGRFRRLRKKNPSLKIAVAGCIAQQEGVSILKRFDHVDYLIGTRNIGKIQLMLEGKVTPLNIDDDPEYHLRTLPAVRSNRVSAWVSIMYGCDNFCSFCIVPYTRGRERSRDYRDICDEIKRLADEGYKEVTLLGQNVNSYGKGLEDDIDFPGLLCLINDIDGIERIRFVTSHPRDLSERLIDAMEELPKVCEHIHLPIQSGSDKILKLMNRGYNYSEYIARIELLRKKIPDIAITTDIIVGFPGETDNDFMQTLKALKEIEFDGIFAFKYSKRPNTSALKLPGHLQDEVKSERLEEVLVLQDDITSKINRQMEGRVVEVLVEGPSKTDRDKLTGRTRTNKIVIFNNDKLLEGILVNTLIIKGNRHSLYGILS